MKQICLIFPRYQTDDTASASHLLAGKIFGYSSRRCASMLHFSLSLSLRSLVHDSYLELIIISSFSFITAHNKFVHCPSLSKTITSGRMLQKNPSSSSSVATSAFDTISIQTSDSRENASLLLYSHLININHNAIDIDDDLEKSRPFSHRYAQSSTDLGVNPDYSLSTKSNEIRSKASTAIRIESALLTSAYAPYTAHPLEHASSLTMDRNMNQTLDLMDRTGAGDENIPSQVHDKQVQTMSRTDPNDYLPLEAVPIQDRRTTDSLFKSKRFLLVSVSMLVCLIFFCSTTILFIK